MPYLFCINLLHLFLLFRRIWCKNWVVLINEIVSYTHSTISILKVLEGLSLLKHYLCAILDATKNKSAFIRRVNKYQSILIGRAVSIILIHSEFYGYDLCKSFWLVLIKLSGLLYILIVLNLNHKFSRIWSQEWKGF